MDAMNSFYSNLMPDKCFGCTNLGEVIYTRAQLDSLKASLNAMQSVAQGWAAVNTIKTLLHATRSQIKACAEQFDTWCAGTVKTLDEYDQRITTAANNMLGLAGNIALAPTTKQALYSAIFGAYLIVWLTAGEFKQRGVQNDWAKAVDESIAALPQTLQTVAQKTGDVIYAATKSVASIPGSIATGLLASLWKPLLVIGGVALAGVFVYAFAKSKAQNIMPRVRALMPSAPAPASTMQGAIAQMHADVKSVRRRKRARAKKVCR
jgi:hypothetical protein